jgi:outer membrane protein TolC
MNRGAWLVIACVAFLIAAARPSFAQGGDSLALGDLERAALSLDPRVRQIQFEEARTRLRLRSIAAERLPSFSLDAEGKYQSDVAEIPIALPGFTRPEIPHDTYDARASLTQRLLDRSIGARASVERAQLQESRARIHTSLFALRQEVQGAFFGAALLQERAGELRATIADLEARLAEARPRVREGTALRGEAAALEATLLERRQDLMTLRGDRAASLAVVAALTGRSITDDAVLVLPDLAAPATEARAAIDRQRGRPEYEQFARMRERLERQEQVAGAQSWPRLSSFARLGYGRPGLNPLGDAFDSYWLAGVQLQWTPWTWGTVGRDRKGLALQREIVGADEAAFTAALRRGLERDLATIDRLDSTLVLDERVIDLREQVERETRLRFREGVVTASEYVDRTNDVLAARLARAAHRVELAQARARLLFTLGLEVR